MFQYLLIGLAVAIIGSFLIAFVHKREFKIVNAKSAIFTETATLSITTDKNKTINIAPVKNNNRRIFNILDNRIVEYQFIGDKDFNRLILKESESKKLAKTIREKGQYVGACGYKSCQAYTY